ncbi:variant leucine-rich repeat-containing protein [Brevibacterium sp. UCMA 11754]|uniref:variant leucine-rich repeat-containing protein n=1 Tax=Brevibacterium sp. UCMA 11754 TaxID=2749198 RepID=UPI001F40001B|nr:hypothetical protein [Brevibacterium sp. UCMA 11754]MCF2574477.1 hypothetical protein [Brevibacterium sp. UCMA 11754]
MSNLNRVQAGIPEDGQTSEAVKSRPDLPPLDENLAQTWSQEYVPSVNADAAMDSLETSIAQLSDEQRHELLETEEQALASTDPEELTQLASHPSPLVRGAVAANESMGERALVTMRDDPDPFVRVSALENPNMSDYAVIQYAKTRAGDDELRACLTGREDNSAVAAAVAANPRTPPETQSHLASIREDSVQAEIAANPSARPEALNYLSAHPNPAIRSAVAANPHVPARTFGTLEREGDPNVAGVIDAERRNHDSAIYDGRDVYVAKAWNKEQKIYRKYMKKMAKRGLDEKGQPLPQSQLGKGRRRGGRLGRRVVSYWVHRGSDHILRGGVRATMRKFK